MNPSDRKVTVIGGGIVGVCCALSLIEKGCHVSLVDEGQLEKKASYGNAGVISPWSCIPQCMPGVWKNIPKWLMFADGPVSFRWSYLLRFSPWVIKFLNAANHASLAQISSAMSALNRPNVELYQRLLKNTGHEDLIKDAFYLQVSKNKNTFTNDSLEYRLRVEQHCPVEIINSAQIKEIEPALSTDYKHALLIKNQARAFNPGQLVQVLTEKFKAQGGEFIKAPVKQLQKLESGEWKIVIQGDSFASDSVVVSAGAWSVNLLTPLGVKLPLANERGYHLEFHQPGITLNHSVMDVDSKFVTSSMASGIRSAGTAEFADLDAKPDYKRAQMLATQTKRLLPDLNLQNTSEWMGTRPSFPDSLPVIGEVPQNKGLFVAFGHSHYGLGMAPKTGQVLADCITGKASDIDLQAYRVNRF